MKITKAFYLEHNKEIVLKYRSGSAGSIGVFKPKNLQEIEDYFKQEHTGWYFHPDFLIQEVIDGVEYYVDFASYNGKHILTAIGRIDKELIHGTFEYLYADNLSLESELSHALKQYAEVCLNALDVKYGLSHVELKDTSKGFRLIELNPRLSGSFGYHNEMVYRRYGQDQVTAYIHLLKNKPFKRNQEKQNLFQRIFYFKNKKGAFTHVDEAPIEALKSYVDHKLITHSMSATKVEQNSLLDIVIYILLESDQQEIIEEDTKKLTEYQSTDDCLK